ncbi:MAG TPA: FG-GAP-like repeat-containing protein [Niastella sp.]
MRPVLLLITLVLTTLVAFCQIPVISSFSPATGPIGTQVVISGNNFSANLTDNTVYFGAVKADVLVASPTALTVEVPTGATFDPLSVTVNKLTTKAASPFIVTTAGGGTNFTATSFDAAYNMSGGQSVTAGDLDGDGKTDLVYINSQADRVKILRNTIQGNAISFVTTTISSIVSPYIVKTADLDGDGLLDLVVTNAAFTTVNVLKNKSTPGNIVFDNPVGFPTGSEPRNLAIGDIDNDGRPDLVVANYSGNSISVFRNTSAGGTISFGIKVDFTTLVKPTGICIGDLDGDGKNDIGVASRDYYVSVFKNSSVTGNISLDARVDYATDYCYDVKMADLDGDGKLDLAVSNTSSVSVFRNTGSPNSLSFATRVNYPVFWLPQDIAVSDLDGDGKPEIVNANWYTSSKACVYKNNSTPGTIAFAPYVGYNTDAGAVGVVLADLNGDGLTDMITANTTNNTLSYLQNRVNNAPSIYSCPELLTPVHNSVNINYSTPVVFTWRKQPNATSYEFRAVHQNGSSSTVTTTDTFYAFNTPAAGVNYTWSVKPANVMLTAPCPVNFAFSTCAATANPYTITATGNTSICSYDSVKLQAPGGVNIQWFLDQKPIPGAMADTLWTKQGGVYSVRVLNGSCYSNPSNTIKVTSLATPVKPVLSKPAVTDICAGSNVSLASSTSSNNQWFQDDVPIPAATNYVYKATATGRYFVQVSNTSTGCVSNSDTVNVTVRPVPTTPVISVTGNIGLCNGDSVKLQSSAAVNIQWYKDGVAIPGAVNADFFAKAAGNYNVGVSQDGCSAYSTSVLITVKALPAAPYIITAGSTALCNGDSVKLQSSVATGNQWFKNDTAITIATGKDYFAKTGGLYAVKTTQNGCTSLSSAKTVITIYPLPARPVITAGGTMMSTNAGYSSYQWYFNNSIILGAVTSQYNATKNGVYKVEVTDQNGCKNSSDNFNFVTTALSDVILQGYTIQWFPNPVPGDLTIQVSAGASLIKPVTMWMIDANGKKVKAEQMLKIGQNTIPMQQLPAGIYWLMLKVGDSQKAVKVFKAG